MYSSAIRQTQVTYVEASKFWRSFPGPDKNPLCLIRHVERNIQPNQPRTFHAVCRLYESLEDPNGRGVVFNKFKDTLPIFESENLLDVHKINQSFIGNWKEREVALRGYLGVRSDLSKKLSFAPLKDVANMDEIQIVSAPSDKEERSHQKLRSMRPYEPVVVRGRLRPKLRPKKANEKSKTAPEDGRRYPEILLEDITALNSVSPEIIIKDGAEYSPEQRFLRLRTDANSRDALHIRDRIMKLCNHYLRKHTFVETPLLFKSTSEGANEYLVPTRRQGHAYALPQSPQQFKQILMASGIHKYYQFARCFRDEDLRADRQPEFTQLDIERSFDDGRKIRHVVQHQIILPLWRLMLNTDLSQSFRSMTYCEAMLEYGSDKPDLRIPFKIRPGVQSILPSDLVGKLTPLSDPIVDAITIPLKARPDQVQIFVSQFLDSDDGSNYLKNPEGSPGIIIYDSSKPLQGLSAFGFEAVEKIEETFPGLGDGHLIVLQARKNVPFSGGSTELGNMRVALHGAAVNAGLLPPLPWRYFEPLWVTDFPLFSPSAGNEPGQGGRTGFKSTHHPFTSPKTAADVDLLLTDPTKAIGDHYDLVINGEEIGGGSRRIHHAAMQEFIFRDVLQMDEEKIAEFAPLLEALRAACPPHAGIALGFDRLVAMVYSHMIKEKVSMRDVIAFPKSGSGDDLMMRSPGRIFEGQLERYHLRQRE